MDPNAAYTLPVCIPVADTTSWTEVSRKPFSKKSFVAASMAAARSY